MKRSMLAIALLSIALLTGCASRRMPSPPSAPTPDVTASSSHLPTQTFPVRISDAGQVVVEVVPLNLDRPGEVISFEVAMNTHSVPLDYNLIQLAILRTSQGDEVAPLRWDGSSGGHHVSGILYFPAVNLEDAQWVEVVIQDVAGVEERIFHWELH